MEIDRDRTDYIYKENVWKRLMHKSTELFENESLRNRVQSLCKNMNTYNKKTQSNFIVKRKPLKNEFNGLLNKVTAATYKKLKVKIIELFETNKGEHDMLCLEYVNNTCNHSLYSKLYVELLCELFILHENVFTQYISTIERLKLRVCNALKDIVHANDDDIEQMYIQNKESDNLKYLCSYHMAISIECLESNIINTNMFNFITFIFDLLKDYDEKSKQFYYIVSIIHVMIKQNSQNVRVLFNYDKQFQNDILSRCLHPFIMKMDEYDIRTQMKIVDIKQCMCYSKPN